MPFYEHLKVYFRHFYETLLLPLFIVLIAMGLFSIVNVNINKFVFIILFFLISLFRYYNIIRVVVDINSSIIKLNLFSGNDKNVIKCEELYNLNCENTIDAIENLKNNESKFVISTPYYKNSTDKVISFELKNDVTVALSVNKPQELYELLSINLI